MVLRSLGVALGLTLVAALAQPEPAEAHHSASYWRALYRERYLVCTDASAANRVHCVGPNQARGPMLAALALGDLAPGTNHDGWIDPARDAAVDAAYYHVREAVPALRRWLDIRLEPRDRAEHTQVDKNALRVEAAFALAHLGDTASAPALADLVGELETAGSGTLWDDTLAALAQLDPGRASRYAIDFVGRQTDFRTSMPGGSGKLLALDYIRSEDAAIALPVLVRLATREETGYDHAHCELMATRVRLDAKLHADVRKLFLEDYGGTWLAGCAESVLQRFTGDPLDAAALVRHLGRDDLGMDYGVTNLAYERILDLEVAMLGRHDAAATRARAVLAAGLAERSAWPHVAAPSHGNYSPHFVALHAAALAGLGDAAAATKLAAIIDDPTDHSGTAWLAALYAVRLGLEGSLDRTAALIARGATYANEERRGALFGGLRGRVLDAYVARAPDDGRWAVLLLDADLRSAASERALDQLAQHQPHGACDAVMAVAPTAAPAAVENALLGLTALGDQCLPQIEALADQRSASGEVRGAALELVAALRSPRLCAHLALAKAEGVWHPAIERAEAMRQPRCSATATPTPVIAPPAKRGHGEQPVPPRIFHQGM